MGIGICVARGVERSCGKTFGVFPAGCWHDCALSLVEHVSSDLASLPAPRPRSETTPLSGKQELPRRVDELLKIRELEMNQAQPKVDLRRLDLHRFQVKAACTTASRIDLRRVEQHVDYNASPICSYCNGAYFLSPVQPIDLRLNSFQPPTPQSTREAQGWLCHLSSVHLFTVAGNRRDHPPPYSSFKLVILFKLLLISSTV